jgi:uncharacterized membrane protein
MSSLDRQSFLSLLISHHRVEELHLCYCLPVGRRRLHFCARCLGVLPAMILAMVLGRLTGPWPEWLVWALLMLAPLPALLDWGVTIATGKPERANWIRCLTGVGLGAGIGTSLYVNTYALLSYPVKIQFIYLLASIWIVWVFSYVRRGKARRERVMQRVKRRPTLEEYAVGRKPEDGDRK